MVLSVEVSREIEASLRERIAGDLNVYAREALGVQLYRDRKLTHGQLQAFLEVGSYEADIILRKHGGVDELSPEELAEQVRLSSQFRRGA